MTGHMPTTVYRMLWPKLRLPITAALGFVIASLAIGRLMPIAALAARPSTPTPFADTALWVNQVPIQETGQELVAAAAPARVQALYVKAGDGSAAAAQFSPALVSEIRSAGVTVCGWTFAYGLNPTAEAGVAVAAVRNGAQCLVIDVEGQYDKLYGAAQLFVRTLRSQLGARFPIGLASQANVLQHPQFPYSVFLGPGAFNVVLPQMYWLDFGVSVDAAYATTIGVNSIYGRPILPVGQLYHSPQSTELARFRGLADAFGARGWSFFDLDSAQPQALAAPLPKPARKAIVAPTLHAGADGDEIVQAQELLNAAGARLPVGGFFGATTARAVASFQLRHHLRPNGALTPATWKDLLRFHPREPSWASGPPDSAR